VNTGQWAVYITFDDKGTKEFADVTTRLYALTGAQHQFAIVLDGKVISAPTTNAIITDGKPMISGSFTQATSKTLADQLKFGALPIGFEVQSRDTISATLGSSQLLSGLLAGLIGLILVVAYSLLQYRALASVTIASLVISATITYLLITLFSWTQGLRLSLAGVAGLIVAIGITADSFIVYFERIRDELRDGRGLESAVDAGWKRAIRTIIASDTVNLLAAVILFALAVGNVRGFAFTLGLTTVIDLIVVSLFTHPVLQLIGRTAFFGEGHRFSGLDPKALGAVYRGRAQFRSPVSVPEGKKATSGREALKRQTIAERKAAELEATRSKGKDS
ncbi:MAG: protein translocase subunit SecD, partial [Rhodoglobus sp.]